MSIVSLLIAKTGPNRYPGIGQDWISSHVSSDIFYTFLCVTGFLDTPVQHRVDDLSGNLRDFLFDLFQNLSSHANETLEW